MTFTDAVRPCGDLPPAQMIFGQSQAMETVRQTIEKVAALHCPVLIRGEDGTGKEVMARLIHRRYPGEDAPFLKVHPPRRGWSLFEEVSFHLQRLPRPEGGPSDCLPEGLARRGTLFLEEVADLDSRAQLELLQLLQDDQGCAIPVRLRILCASQCQLERKVESKKFRLDLLNAIQVVSLYLPPLRDRRTDIPGLVDYFWESYNAKFGCQASPPSARLMQTLQRYHWPGNIRELGNQMKRYVLLGSEEIIGDKLLGPDSRRSTPHPPSSAVLSLKEVTRQATHELERKIILKTLRDNHWNRKHAARALNISYRALLYKIKEAGVPPKRLRLAAEMTEMLSGDQSHEGSRGDTTS